MKNTNLILLSLLLCCHCSKDGTSGQTDKHTNNDNITETPNCLVSEIRFATSKFEYQYNTDGLYLINDYYNESLSPYYVEKVTNDSIAIGLILNDSSHDTPLITAKYEGTNLMQIKRFYSTATSGTNIFNFNYSDGKISIAQEYDTGTSIQHIAYGDYFLDQNGDVSMVKKYEYDANSPTNYTLSEEKSFTYDNSINPWQGIVFPTFSCQSLPSSKFISANNIKTETKNSTTTAFSYVYDENNLTIKGIGQYPYSVCNTSNRLDEFYSYSDCSN